MRKLYSDISSVFFHRLFLHFLVEVKQFSLTLGLGRGNSQNTVSLVVKMLGNWTLFSFAVSFCLSFFQSHVFPRLIHVPKFLLNPAQVFSLWWRLVHGMHDDLALTDSRIFIFKLNYFHESMHTDRVDVFWGKSCVLFLPSASQRKRWSIRLVKWKKCLKWK